MHPSSAITSLKLQVELLSLPRRCGQHGVSTNGDGECHLDAFHPLPMHNLGRFGNQSTVEEPYNGGKTHAISDTEFGGVGLGVYRGFVSLTVLRNSIRLKSALLNLLRAAAGCQDHRWDFGDSPVINPIFCEVLVPTSANPNTPFSAPEISILSEAGMPTCDQRPVPVDCLFNHLPSLLHRRRPMSGLTVAAKRVCPENCRWRPCVRSFQGLSCIDCRARPFTSASCKSPSKTTWVPPARILKDVPSL